MFLGFRGDTSSFVRDVTSIDSTGYGSYFKALVCDPFVRKRGKITLYSGSSRDESSKTTEIYTHFTQKSWDNLKNPLEDLEI